MSPGAAAAGRPAADSAVGALAGAVNVFVGFPFDTLKVRLQSASCPHAGAWSALVHIVRHEGPRALFRGVSPPLIGGALETGVNYATYGAALAALARLDPSAASPPPPPRLAAVGLAAGTAGAVLSVVLSPFELVKCRMQLDQGKLFLGPVDCLRHLLRTEGARGLALGLGGTMAREVPGNAIFFVTYEALRRHALPGRPPGGGERAPRSLGGAARDAASATACGGAAGVAMWAAVLPIDVAKTRIQTSYLPAARVGLLEQLAVLRQEGRLYAGLRPTLVRAFPANAAQWLTWELCRAYL